MYSLTLVHLIPSWLVYAEIKRSVNVCSEASTIEDKVFSYRISSQTIKQYRQQVLTVLIHIVYEARNV